MVDKDYYEKVVKKHNITPKKFDKTSHSSNKNFWYGVGGDVPYFLWGWLIGTGIAFFLVGRYVIFPVLNVWYSTIFGCSIDNPMLITFTTIAVGLLMVKLFLTGDF